MYILQCYRACTVQHLTVTQSEMKANCLISGQSEMAVMTFKGHCVENVNQLHAPTKTVAIL